MSSSGAVPLTSAEHYLQSLTYGLIISTGILSIIVCSLRVSSLPGKTFDATPEYYYSKSISSHADLNDSSTQDRSS